MTTCRICEAVPATEGKNGLCDACYALPLCACCEGIKGGCADCRPHTYDATARWSKVAAPVIQTIEAERERERHRERRARTKATTAYERSRLGVKRNRDAKSRKARAAWREQRRARLAS